MKEKRVGDTPFIHLCPRFHSKSRLLDAVEKAFWNLFVCLLLLLYERNIQKIYQLNIPSSAYPLYFHTILSKKENLILDIIQVKITHDVSIIILRKFDILPYYLLLLNAAALGRMNAFLIYTP